MPRSKIFLVLLFIAGFTALSLAPAIATREPRTKMVVFTGIETKIEVPGVPMESLNAPLIDRAGQVVGKLDVLLTFTFIPQQPNGKASGLVTGVASLPLGQIAFQGSLQDGDAPFKLAITGGTDAYRRARGYIRVTPTDEDEGSRLAIHVTS